jgi:hypothetical protein
LSLTSPIVGATTDRGPSTAQVFPLEGSHGCTLDIDYRTVDGESCTLDVDYRTVDAD